MATPQSTAFFSPAYDHFDGQLSVFLNEHYSSVVDAVRGPLTAALVIYIALYALLIMRGVVQEPLQDFVWRIAKLCLLFIAATTIAYKGWITEPLFHGAPSAVTQAISGKEYTSMGEVFDHLRNKAVPETTQLTLKGNEASESWAYGIAVRYYLLAIGLALSAALAAIVGFAISMMALVALAIVIALGPIMIALSLFRWGEGFFQGWLRQAFNYIVLLAVITALADLILTLGDTVITASTGPEDDMAKAMFQIVYFLLGTLFFFQAPSIASGITGGAALGAGEMVAAAGFGTVAGVGSVAAVGTLVGRRGMRAASGFSRGLRRSRGGSVSPGTS